MPITVEQQKLLNQYAVASRVFSDVVERLRQGAADGELFIRLLGETGTAHRACEQARIKLHKHLAFRPLTPAASQPNPS